MKIANSRITSQGQVSVPAEVRRCLGVAPGSILEWTVEGDMVIIRRAGRHTSLDIHRALFPHGPPAPKTLEQLKESIGEHMKKKYARR